MTDIFAMTNERNGTGANFDAAGKKRARLLLRFGVVLVLALGTGACSTISDAGSALASLDPTGIFGDDSTPAAPDQSAADQTAATTDDSAAITPDLANMPPTPVPQTTPAQNQQTANALSADRSQVQYSADALRAGTEASAAPPPAADLPPAAGAVTRAETAAPPPSVSASDSALTAPPSAQPLSPDTTVASAVPAAAPAKAFAPVDGAEPAVPMGGPDVSGSMVVAPLQPGVMSDAALGFKPSSAPPLDPSISQWVSSPILARYRQTAMNAGIANSPIAAVQTSAKGRKSSPAGVGGPDTMSGAVVANLDALQATPTSVSANMNGGMAPTAVVYFPGDGTTLNSAALADIRGAVAAYKASGGQSSIRVVGHASSRTANMPVEKHLMVIFQKSQARATAVAKELIREGIPADKVLVDAVGDSEPVYYESMPKGEDGNRRAEIFIQG